MAVAGLQGGSAQSEGPAWGARARSWAENEEQQVPTYTETLERVGLVPGSDVLDIGCGSGVFMREVAARGGRPAGLDASEALAALARERVPGADVRVGDMEQLPFADDTFDLVTGFNSFFFAADIGRALREAARVARPGASVVMQVWGRAERCDLTRITGAVRALVAGAPAAGAPAPAPLCTPGVLEGIAAEAGMTARSAFDVSYPIDYPDRTTAVRRMLAPGKVVQAMEHVGEAAVRDAVVAALSAFRTSDGAYRLENEWHVLVAQA